MDVRILGPGCKNCVLLEGRTREAIEALGLDATVTKVTDYADIAAYGVLATPALVVDGEVVVVGRVPTVDHLRRLLSEGR